MAPSMAPTVLQPHTTPPLTVSRGLLDPRHAWMNFDGNRIFRYWIEEHPRVAWIYVSTKVDTYQQQPGIIEGGALWVCGV